MVSSQTSVAELVGALPELGRPRVPNPSRSTDARRGYGIVVLIIVLLIGMFVSVAIGIRAIPLASTWDAVFSFDPANSDHLLVRHQRVPRALLSGFVGVCLGVAGAVMQALIRNPLAEPGILGVNSGAAVAGVAVFFLGGVRRGVNPVRLVLAGAALSVVLGALTHIVLVNSVDDVFDRYRHWMVGSVAGRGYEVLLPVVLLGAVGLVMALALTRALDSAMLGEDLSRSLGGNPVRVWSLAGMVVITLAGVATAAAGPITFLGLASPHVARLLVGATHRWVLPYSALIAAVLIVSADTLGRAIPPTGEVSVGIMVAILGGPFFVALVRRRKIAQL